MGWEDLIIIKTFINDMKILKYYKEDEVKNILLFNVLCGAATTIIKYTEAVHGIETQVDPLALFLTMSITATAIILGMFTAKYLYIDRKELRLLEEYRNKKEYNTLSQKQQKHTQISNNYKMYILVNEDIKISKGKLAGQVGHAVMSYIYYNAVKPLEEGKEIEPLDGYMKQQKKIILKCPQWKLEELERSNANVSVIRDNGLTQLEPNTLTCVNIGILNSEFAPDWVKGLKLYN